VKGVKKKLAIQTGSLFKNMTDAIGKMNEKAINVNVKRYVQMIHQSIEIEKEREMLYMELSEEEKREAEHLLKDLFQSELPEFMPVSEVAQMLNVTPQMVRRYCAEGKIIAKQRLENSGQWLIPTEQFVTRPEFFKYLKDKEMNRIKSIKAAELMLHIPDGEIEE
jgi:hypothetical protein